MLFAPFPQDFLNFNYSWSFFFLRMSLSGYNDIRESYNRFRFNKRIKIELKEQYQRAGLALSTRILIISSSHCPASGAGHFWKEELQSLWQKLSTLTHFCWEFGEQPSDSPGVLDHTTASRVADWSLAWISPTLEVGLSPRPPLTLHHCSHYCGLFLASGFPFLPVSVIQALLTPFLLKRASS